MSDLHPITGKTETVADIIFVHGLGGHWRGTWAADPAREDTYWPNWLTDHVSSAKIWSLEYEAHRSNWRPGLSLVELADQVLELLTTKGIGIRPIVFVTHSLGGLLVKSVLRASFDALDHKAKRIASATRGIAFFATPNSGAHIANSFVRLLGWLGPLGQVYRVSGLVEELRENRPELLKLNQWYRDQVSSHMNGLNISTKVYYEKRPGLLGMVSIVNGASADPGIPGIRPVPVAANHFDICKFSGRETWLYENVVQFLTESLKEDPIGPSSIGQNISSMSAPVGGDAEETLSPLPNPAKVIELAFVGGKIPPKVRLEIDTNIIENENITVLLTRVRGGSND